MNSYPVVLLEGVTVKVSDDAAQLDPDLVCDSCGQVLCSIEHGDTLSVLADVAVGHKCGED